MYRGYCACWWPSDILHRPAFTESGISSLQYQQDCISGFFRIVDAIKKALSFLFLRKVQKELDDPCAATVQAPRPVLPNLAFPL